jgi:hypothetical protein
MKGFVNFLLLIIKLYDAYYNEQINLKGSCIFFNFQFSIFNVQWAICNRQNKFFAQITAKWSSNILILLFIQEIFPDGRNDDLKSKC